MRHRGIVAAAMAATLATGCSEMAAVATAPVTATVMTIGARLNDDGLSADELRQTSEWQADAALMRALEQGIEGSSATWSNPSDPEGPASGRATLLSRSRGTEGETCWRVRTESRIGSAPAETSTRLLCPVGRNGWIDMGEQDTAGNAEAKTGHCRQTQCPDGYGLRMSTRPESDGCITRCEVIHIGPEVFPVPIIPDPQDSQNS